MRGLKSLVAVLAALVVVPSALAGPGMSIGADEDASKALDLATSRAKMDLARLAGLDQIRLTALWNLGQTAPTSDQLTRLQNAVDAAALSGIRPTLSVSPTASGQTPTTDQARADFVAYATSLARSLPGANDMIIGNEPNSNAFWMPQFNADGSDAAAPAYLALLAQAYDALKAVRSSITIYGGALDPRGGDCATCAKPTHSPTTFIKDLGAAYRASGRTAPIMDVFDMHAYQDYSALPPSFLHPLATTIALPDYGKLVSLLTGAFDGTAQPGSTLPIQYGEFGVETTIPADKQALYSGTEVAGVNPADPQTQAAYYREALKIAACQPNVKGILFFLVTDESSMTGWQSGVRYAGDSAKPSLQVVVDSAAQARAGTLTSCPDQVLPTATLTTSATGTVSGTLTLTATAADDVGVGKVDFLVNGSVVKTKALPPYTVTWTTGADGPATLTSRAQDAAGNYGTSEPVTVTVANAPDTTIQSAPAGPVGASGASFTFISTEKSSTFECSVDGGAFAACTSPAAYTGVADGVHSFAARAIDAAGNVDPTPATGSWTVDTTAPVTTITSGPSGTVNATSAAFAFSANETASFQCRIDGATFASCSSPVSYSGLAGGAHTFDVIATDALGNAAQTAVSRAWTVSNDFFAAAYPLTGMNGRGSGSTAGASREAGEPRHAGQDGGHSVWFTWVAPASGTAVLDTFGSSFDTLLAIYTGTAVSALRQVAANDNSNGMTSRTSFYALAGTTYRIAVDGKKGASGAYVLGWSLR